MTFTPTEQGRNQSPAEPAAVAGTPGLPVIFDTPLEATVLGGKTFYVKRELDNPSGSHYDRAYVAHIQALQDLGLIAPGDELRDISSGSAGISLAWVGKTFGYPVRVIAPSELPEARIQPMRENGATVERSTGDYILGASQMQRNEILRHVKDQDWRRILVPKELSSAIIFEHKTEKMPRVCFLNHSESPITVQAFSEIGHEIVRSLTSRGVVPAVAALAIGNWTTIAGIAPVLRQAFPDINVIGYQSAPGGYFRNFGTNMSGASGTEVPMSFRDESLVNRIVSVENSNISRLDKKFQGHVDIANRVGRSSIMGLVVARDFLTKAGSDHAVTIAYDSATRY